MTLDIALLMGPRMVNDLNATEGGVYVSEWVCACELQLVHTAHAWCRGRVSSSIAMIVIRDVNLAAALTTQKGKTSFFGC